MNTNRRGLSPIKKVVALGAAAALVGVGAVLAVAGPASAHGNGHDKPEYVTVAWNYQGYPDLTKPQPFIDAKPGTDINAFDSLAQQCGAHIQVDVYKTKVNGKSWESLKTPQGLLYSHDGGFLAYGLGFTPYKVIHGPENQTTDPAAPCFTGPEKPTKEPVVSVWRDGTISCDVDTVTQTRTVTTTTYTYDGAAWVEHSDVKTETQERPKTAEEIKACEPVITPPTEEPKPEVVTPLPPQFVDVCGVNEDQVQVPTDVEHVTYTVNDQRKDGVGVVTVTATADKGYVFTKGEHDTTTTLTWPHEFTDEKCAEVPPVTTPPTSTPTPPATTPTPKPTTPDSKPSAPAGTTVTAKNAPKPSASATPAATGTLAYTGSEGLLAGGIAAGILLLVGTGVLSVRSIRKARSNS